MDFNVMSFNLRYWNDGDQDNAWPHRRDQVAKVILEYDPMVIGIQEGLIEMLEDLDARLPDFARVGEGRLGGNESEFSAIYYRTDLVEVKAVDQMWLSETPTVVGSKSWDSSLSRICTWAQMEIKASKKQFMMFNTHLDHRGSLARLKGVELIWGVMLEYVEQGLPCVLTGDFNCQPQSEPIQFLRSHLVDAAQSQGKGSIGTFHDFTGTATGGPIDYIFCTPNIAINDVEIVEKQVDNRYPSDHFIVTANIEL